MRSIWKGVLSFGLVTVPVRLYTATESRDVHLRYLHGACSAPVQYRKVCSACGQEVQPQDLSLGYEAAPDAFIVLEREELESLPAGPDRVVEIGHFVPLDAVDPVFFAKAYYLEPQPGGQKAYQLLHEAMAEENRAAVVRLSLRRRERWAVVRAGEAGVLHLETLLDADEVRPPAEIATGDPAVLRAGERELARDLVRALAADFRPEENPDRYRAALTALIEHKVAGGESVTRPNLAESARVIDLMQALRASLASTGQEPAGRPSTGRAKGRGRRAPSESLTPPTPPRTHAGTRGGPGL